MGPSSFQHRWGGRELLRRSCQAGAMTRVLTSGKRSHGATSVAWRLTLAQSPWGEGTETCSVPRPLRRHARKAVAPPGSWEKSKTPSRGHWHIQRSFNGQHRAHDWQTGTCHKVTIRTRRGRKPEGTLEAKGRGLLVPRPPLLGSRTSVASKVLFPGLKKRAGAVATRSDSLPIGHKNSPEGGSQLTRAPLHWSGGGWGGAACPAGVASNSVWWRPVVRPPPAPLHS